MSAQSKIQLEFGNRKGKNRSTRTKTFLSRVENQQQTQPIYDAGSGNRTRDTLVGGERSHHCAIPTPQLRDTAGNPELRQDNPNLSTLLANQRPRSRSFAYTTIIQIAIFFVVAPLRTKLPCVPCCRCTLWLQTTLRFLSCCIIVKEIKVIKNNINLSYFPFVG